MKIIPPRRASHTYVQQLCAPPERVFPLLCPVREADWIEGWDPVFVASASGLAERDCVFVTASGGQEAIWTITRHEPERGFVEMVKVTPGVTVCRLTIEVRPAPDGPAAVRSDPRDGGPVTSGRDGAVRRDPWRGAAGPVPRGCSGTCAGLRPRTPP